MNDLKHRLLSIGAAFMLGLLLFACQKEDDFSKEIEQQKQRIDSLANNARYPLSITFTDSIRVDAISPGGVRSVGYNIESALNELQVEAIGSNGLIATVEPDSDCHTGLIQIKAGEYLEQEGKVVVLVTDGYSLLMRTLCFEKTIFHVDSITNIQIDRKGGTITLPYLANVICRVEIPQDAQSWITTVSTKAAIQHEHTLCISANDGRTRSAQVTLMDPDRWKQITFKIEQGGGGDAISFCDANIKAALVACFDLDGDGQISYSEADSVTSLEGVFPADKSYTSFNEFQYFTRVKELPARCFTDQTLLKSITLPEGLTKIGDRAFYQCRQLQEIELPATLESIGRLSFGWCYALEQVLIPDSVTTIGDAAFASCISLKKVKGKYATNDERCLILDDRLIAFAMADLERFAIPEGVISIAPYAFTNSTVPRIDLPSSLKEIEHHAFWSSAKLAVIYLKAIEPPTIGEKAFYGSDDLGHIFVPKENMDAYLQSWTELKEKIDYKRIPDEYRSTDFSHNGTVIPLQIATRGNGIDIVIMGDAFCDLSIADGTYHSIMQKAQEAFFSVEPYKSYRDCFNFYEIEVVSEREGFEEGNDGHAFNTWFREDKGMGGNDSIAIKMARNAIVDDDRMDNVAIVVLSNNLTRIAGSEYIYDPTPENQQKDYACGLSVGFLSVSSNYQRLTELILHEVGGHGFSKLEDEYVYKNQDSIPPSIINHYTQKLFGWGWCRNIDFTSSPNIIKWSPFLNDLKYESEEIGIYEGGCGYAKGVWRPSQTSIMVDGKGIYNAPSRYAIWYRIQRLAFGEEQPADYEDFVAFDKSTHNGNRRSAPRRDTRDTEENLQLKISYSYPPVLTGKTWKDYHNK